MGNMEDASTGEINREDIMADEEKGRNGRAPGVPGKGEGVRIRLESQVRVLRKRVLEKKHPRGRRCSIRDQGVH